MKQLSAVVVEPNVTPTASVIWLHGLGSNGHDFEALLPELGLPEDAPIRFIFPHSPSIPVTINGGMVMPAWYDILSMGAGRTINEVQLLASSDQVAALIDQEREKGIASDRILLVGFSQGGAVAYHTALTYPHPLAGLLALSTYFPTADGMTVSAANHALPIEIMHGRFDPVVYLPLAKSAYTALQQLGLSPNWREYNMEHQVCYPQITDMSAWIRHILSV
ncbi:alpha/beta hydrolase [Photobacterium japonica]|uniref:alpha/beta hydrolase n=1 Tax=Photobacterium japonica TaxID=2910235 RepID=UPI003D0A2329